MVQEEERGLLGEAETPVPEPSEEEKEQWYMWNLMGEDACAATLSDKAAMYVLDKATPGAYTRDNPACEVRGPHALRGSRLRIAPCDGVVDLRAALV